MHRIYWMIAGLLVMAPFGLKAQAANDTVALFHEMKQLQQVYSTQALSFDIRYTYASERHPTEILDSLSGKMEMSGSNYDYQLDSVESIVNAKYSITIFKKDKMIYLAKPNPAAMSDPIQQLRRMLQNGGVVGCTITQQRGRKVVTISFAGTSPYRQVEMEIDKKTGYMTAMRYVMKTAMLLGTAAAADISEANATYGEYAIVETTFDHYIQDTLNNERFDESNIFYKEGMEFKPTPAYSDYKIFKGSPNL